MSDSPPVALTNATAVSAVQPGPPALRRLGGLDLAFLWFGAAVCITEIWAGGLPGLTGLGLGLGLVAIVLGRICGNGLMAAVAFIGARTGLPGMVLSRAALGVNGSYALAVLNVLQLVGWTGWMLFVGFGYCDILAGALHLPTAAEQPLMKLLWVCLIALLSTLWALGGENFWKWVQHLSTALLALLCIAMTWIVLRSYDAGALLAAPSGSAVGLLAGADLVIAMSISWVPLVADYSRYARSPRGASAGTFWGYFVGGTWMYATGLLVALATGKDTPDQMVVQVMGQPGLVWALLAAVLVLLSTVTTTFLDIFSSVVSAQSLAPKLPLRAGTIACGVLGVGCAMLLDVNAYAPFLLVFGELFLPAFTVVAVDYFFVRRRELAAGWMQRSVSWPGVLAWLAGIIVFDWAQGGLALTTFGPLMGYTPEIAAWPTGASLPCIAVSALAYLLLTRLPPRANG